MFFYFLVALKHFILNLCTNAFTFPMKKDEAGIATT